MKILLFDDHLLFGESIVKLLADYEIDCDYVDLESDFIERVNRETYDIILLDINLSGRASANGIELMAEILKLDESLKIVILSSYDLPIYRKRAFQNGAVGYINKSVPIEDFIKTLREVKAGQFSKDSNEYMESLTEREVEVLRAICTGEPRREIARRLYISERTLYNHIQSIYEKLEVVNAVEAYNRALELGYLEP